MNDMVCLIRKIYIYKYTGNKLMTTRIKKLSPISAVAAACLVSLSAIAASGPELVDLDGDGVISAEEIVQIRDEYKQILLSAYDTDGDGELSRDERSAMRMARETEMLNTFDTDGDGELSRDERRAAHEERRAAMETQLDVNQDGVVSDEESAGFDSVKSERGRGHGRDHGRDHGGERGGEHGGKRSS